jgi:hypothetical protein
MDENMAAAVEVVKDSLVSGSNYPYRVVNDTVATPKAATPRRSFAPAVPEGKARAGGST